MMVTKKRKGAAFTWGTILGALMLLFVLWVTISLLLGSVDNVKKTLGGCYTQSPKAGVCKHGCGGDEPVVLGHPYCREKYGDNEEYMCCTSEAIINSLTDNEYPAGSVAVTLTHSRFGELTPQRTFTLRKGNLEKITIKFDGVEVTKEIADDIGCTVFFRDMTRGRNGRPRMTFMSYDELTITDAPINVEKTYKMNTNADAYEGISCHEFAKTGILFTTDPPEITDVQIIVQRGLGSDKLSAIFNAELEFPIVEDLGLVVSDTIQDEFFYGDTVNLYTDWPFQFKFMIPQGLRDVLCRISLVDEDTDQDVPYIRSGVSLILDGTDAPCQELHDSFENGFAGLFQEGVAGKNIKLKIALHQQGPAKDEDGEPVNILVGYSEFNLDFTKVATVTGISDDWVRQADITVSCVNGPPQCAGYTYAIPTAYPETAGNDLALRSACYRHNYDLDKRAYGAITGTEVQFSIDGASILSDLNMPRPILNTPLCVYVTTTELSDLTYPEGDNRFIEFYIPTKRVRIDAVGPVIQEGQSANSVICNDLGVGCREEGVRAGTVNYYIKEGSIRKDNNMLLEMISDPKQGAFEKILEIALAKLNEKDCEPETSERYGDHTLQIVSEDGSDIILHDFEDYVQGEICVHGVDALGNRGQPISIGFYDCKSFLEAHGGELSQYAQELGCELLQ